MMTHTTKEETPGNTDITDLPLTRIIIVVVFAVFFGTLLYVLNNEFFTR